MVLLALSVALTVNVLLPVELVEINAPLATVPVAELIPDIASDADHTALTDWPFLYVAPAIGVVIVTTGFVVSILKETVLEFCKPAPLVTMQMRT